jgi:hypothetical protein
MSLILDALKKLERDRTEAAPSVVVVGAVPWEGVRRRSPLWLVTAVLVLAAAAGATLWLLRPRTAAPVVMPPAAATPAPAPSAAATAPPSPTLAAAAPPVAAARPAGADTPPAPRPLVVPGPAQPARAAAATPKARPAPAAASGLRLVAISERDGRPVAMINDHLLFEGDSFDGVRVVRIGAADVEIEVRGERRVLRF